MRGDDGDDFSMSYTDIHSDFLWREIQGHERQVGHGIVLNTLQRHGAD